MTASSPRPSRPWGTLGAGAAALAACAVCCAGPILAVLGGIGVTSAIGALWMPALAVLALVAGLGVLVVRRRRRTASCRTAGAQADLGMPTFGPPPEADGTRAPNEGVGHAGGRPVVDVRRWPEGPDAARGSGPSSAHGVHGG
ncbi:hypothetical protein [Streptomyces sp. NPDC007905]|uniref:hypothetical protein n=1 Tax=Streptomyces sp. NPDC007905 TaxID=3364788 RepID=UPI0036F0DB6F